jgi:aspartyl-tRNA(Asn)/glutamyl-tRNA(Gln) amidotransferase subunit C
MYLSIEEVKRIGRLARIALTEAEADALRRELEGILGLIDEMQAVDTTGVEPMSHAQDVVLRLRPDAVTEIDRREQFQALAPQTEQGLYLVPKVIE